MLGRGVDRQEGVAGQAEHRAQVDDHAAAPLPAKLADRPATGGEDGPDVGGNLQIEELVRCVRYRVAADHIARVVDQDIEAAKSGNRFRQEMIDRPRLCDVPLQDVRTAACLRNGSSHRLGLCARTIVMHGYEGAGGPQSARNGGANSAAGASDQANLVLEVARDHTSSPELSATGPTGLPLGMARQGGGMPRVLPDAVCGPRPRAPRDANPECDRASLRHAPGCGRDHDGPE